jgi:ribonuclease D
MATRTPGSLAALEAIPALAPSVVRKRGDELLQLIAAAKDDDGIEPMAPPRRPSNEEQALAGALMQVVRDAAAALEIGPETLATRRDVESLAFGSATPQTSPLLQGWRGEVLGEKLLTVLSTPSPANSGRGPG